ncbi:MAG TPA: hypothetical protein VE093_38985 [Polyangiaceae bacterium]|nr:hypothetical protein [Polyangiaceae bacterium]
MSAAGSCKRFDREGALRLERGEPLDGHFAECAECVEAQSTYRRITSSIGALAGLYSPPDDLESIVLTRIHAIDIGGSDISDEPGKGLPNGPEQKDISKSKTSGTDIGSEYLFLRPRQRGIAANRRRFVAAIVGIVAVALFSAFALAAAFFIDGRAHEPSRAVPSAKPLAISVPSLPELSPLPRAKPRRKSLNRMLNEPYLMFDDPNNMPPPKSSAPPKASAPPDGGPPNIFSPSMIAD